MLVRRKRTRASRGRRDILPPCPQVRETMDFSASVNGVGHEAQELKTLMDREAEQGIDPDPEMDAFMKASSLLIY